MNNGFDFKDLLAYTKHLSDEYRYFRETLQYGYTDPRIMEQVKKKKILSRLEQGYLDVLRNFVENVSFCLKKQR